MIEALERRHLFSFGLNATPPTAQDPALIAAYEAPEQPHGSDLSPADVHGRLAFDRGPQEAAAPAIGRQILVQPVFTETIIATPAFSRLGSDQEDLQDYLGIDSQVTILLLNPRLGSPPAQSSSSPVTPGYLNAESRENASYDAERTYIPPSFTPTFTPVRDELNLAKLTVNLISRLDANEGARVSPLVGFDSRLQPVVNPATSVTAHPGGVFSTRVGGDPTVIELQLRRPMEAPAGSPGQMERLASAPTLASLVAINDEVSETQDFLRTADHKSLWQAGGRPTEAASRHQGSDAVAYAALDAPAAAAAWGSLIPLMPQLSADANQLSEAFQTVFADLDDLGGEIVSSLADPDRIAWGLGAVGIGYYVAGFRRPFGNRSSETASPDPSRHLPRRRPLTFARLQDL